MVVNENILDEIASTDWNSCIVVASFYSLFYHFNGYNAPFVSLLNTILLLLITFVSGVNDKHSIYKIKYSNFINFYSWIINYIANHIVTLIKLLKQDNFHC